MIENWQLPRLAGLNADHSRPWLSEAELVKYAETAFRQNYAEKRALGQIRKEREQQRITALHQQADTEHWHGQIFKRLEEA